MKKMNYRQLRQVVSESVKTILNEITVQDAYQQHYKNIPQEDFETIVTTLQGDDNVLSKDAKWALQCYKNSPQDCMSYVSELHTNDNDGFLDIYNRLKAINRIDERDKNLKNFKTLSDLKTFVNTKMEELGDEEIWGDNTHRKKKNMTDAQKSAKDDIDVIYEDDDWFVLTPKSYEASVYWGSNTRWCTAYKDTRRYYDDYTKQGRLFININKSTKEKYQFHFESGSFMYSNDQAIDKPIFNSIYKGKRLEEVYREIVPKSSFSAAELPLLWNKDGVYRYVYIEENEEVSEEEDYVCYYNIIDENHNIIDYSVEEIDEYVERDGLIHTLISPSSLRYVFIDLYGNRLTPTAGRLRFLANGIYGIAHNLGDKIKIYKNGKLLTEQAFNDVKPNYDSFDRAVVKLNNMYNIINLENGELILSEWIDCYSMSCIDDKDNIIITYNNRNYAIMTKNGEFVSDIFNKSLHYNFNDRLNEKLTYILNEYQNGKTAYNYLTFNGKTYELAFDTWFGMPFKLEGNKYVSYTIDGKKCILNNDYTLSMINESRNMKKDILNEISVRDARQQHYQDIPQSDWITIISSLQEDLTVLQPETKWALGLYKRNSPRFMEDLYKLHDKHSNIGYLDIFKRAKERRMISGAQADLNKYKSISELGAFVKNLDVHKILGITKGEMSNAVNAAAKDAEFPYEDDTWKVVIPKSYEASCYWGKDTEWCTATRSSREMYDSYTEEGKLFININKRNNEKYQFHFESESFMDKYDEPIDKPIFSKIGATEGLINFYKNYIDSNTFMVAEYDLLWREKGNERFSVIKEENDEPEYYLLNGNNNVLAGPFKFIGQYRRWDGDIIVAEITTMNETYNFIDLNGNLISDKDFNSDIVFIKNGIIAGADLSNRYYIYKNGELLTDKSFYSVSAFLKPSDRYLLVKESITTLFKPYNFLDLENGELKFETGYLKDADNFNTKEVACVSNGKGWFLINKQCEKISDSYHYIRRNYYFFPQKAAFFVTDEDRKVNCLSHDGKLLLDKWLCSPPKAITDPFGENEEKVFIASYYDDINYKCIPSIIRDINVFEPIKGNGNVNENVSVNELKYIIHEATRQLLQEISVVDAQNAYYKDIPQDIFEQIVEGVQGNNNILLPITKQMLELYRKSSETDKQMLLDDAKWTFRNQTGGNKPEDMGLLDIWERALLKEVYKGNDKNLSRFNTYSDWKNELRNLSVKELFRRTQGEWSRAVKAAKNDIKKIYEDDEWLVISPNSMDASCYWGSDTHWCTATRNEETNYFNSYNKKGPLYININKATGKKYQFSFSHSEFNDEFNEPIETPILDTIDASNGMKSVYKELTKNNWEHYFQLFENNLSEDDYVFCERLDAEFGIVTRNNPDTDDIEMNIHHRGEGLISDFWYKWIDDIDYRMTIVRVKSPDNTYGILDLETGRILVDNYDYIDKFNEYDDWDDIFYSIGQKNNKKGLIVYNSEQDSFYRPYKFYANIEYPYSGNYGLFKIKHSDGDVAYMDINGEIIGDYYDKIFDFDGDEAMVVKDGMFNYMNYEGELTGEWQEYR